MSTMMEDVPDELDLVELGRGNYDLTPRNDSRNIPHCTLPFDIPPVLPDLRDQLENLLSNPERLPIHSIDFDNRLPPREPNVSSLLSIDVLPLQTTLEVERDIRTGELLGFKEVRIVGAGANAKNSMSLKRMPGSPNDGVMGSNTNFPFLPGGMEDLALESLHEIIHQGPVDFENNLLTTPPGFKEGIVFQPEKKSKEKSSVSLAEILVLEDTLDLMGITEEPKQENHIQTEAVQNTAVPQDLKEELEDVVSKEVPAEVLSISKVASGESLESRNTEWAIVIDVTRPVTDFEKLLPNMAYKWEFELDTFQKQAIIHLENHDNVFVAAHTSAGKTVVAEYAVALALKHGTKAVYTSPVKALSNQKFRDFKTTFKDIGLLTGDVQVNTEASCLIMTTEILRSMLYNGSDIVRELEWVIFDEVHYINDKERGVVWEEVLIMLPKQVKLVLLSATVSNTMELADWVGRTKKSKIYVITTLKRPVPLEHFLYTGTVGKQQNEMFLLVDSQGNFLERNYQAAMLAKKNKPITGKPQNFGTKGPRVNVGTNQEKNIYRGVIGQLQKDDKLPVVCFTLSRKRCNDNANMMTSLDLTTAAEKNIIHRFFVKSIGMLKDVDRNLPQVRNMKKLLDRGLGIHHSGILPILKEVVEMLFQQGLIKVLFATETFAMGVNMPARTVVFDHIRKHDGVSFRDLLSSEYIQMAGRAGRRGLDKTGTVLILCKADVPEMSSLYTMMLGKPTELESKFRLTYIMILNLMRARQLKIEEVIKRSFGEAKAQKNKEKQEASLQSVMSQLASLTELFCGFCTDIEQYCQSLKRYIALKKECMMVLPSFRNCAKLLTPGRLVTIYTDFHPNVPAVILTNIKNKKLSVLIVRDRGDFSENVLPSDENEIAVEPIHPWTAELFYPLDTYEHVVLEVGLDRIQNVGLATLQISADKVLAGWRQRQEPRFKDAPPGQSTVAAIQELCRITKEQGSGLITIKYPLGEQHNFNELTEYERSFPHYNCVSCPSFKDHLNHINKNLVIQESVAKIKYLLSDESLQLLPEYQGRIAVLKELEYIDENRGIKMKGRVACQMSNHELLLTEILIRNVLTNCSPAESAALLSCFVFQQKTEIKVETLPKTLQNGISEIVKIAQQLDKLHSKHHIYEEQFESELKFGLTGVVHEWAKGVLFSEIAEMTEVEEGIVVRTIQRLVEVLRDVRNAAHIFGDETLHQKMDDALVTIKRDIVFAASLYVQ